MKAIYCSEECKLTACCDFCVHVIYNDGERFGPTNCGLHLDAEHQEIAEYCGVCSDFHCCLANKEEGKWIEV